MSDAAAWRAINRAHWDEKVGIHLGPRGYDLTALREERGRFYPIEEAELGPVSIRGGADDEALAANTGRKWSDAELKALGEMIVRGVSIAEIARRLRRDHGEVRDKVAEVGQACR